MNDVKILGVIEITGLKELELRLAQLPQKLERRILMEAVKAGARVIQKEAREKAPKSIAPHILRSYASALFKGFKSDKMGVWILPGNLKKMIRVKVDRTKSRGYAVTYEVYVKNKEAWYWKFVELGTSKMGPNSFMRNSFEATKYAAIKTVENEIRNRLEYEGVA